MTDEDTFGAAASRHRSEKWRREWINRFRERQRVAGRWIEFVEIAKWCARSTTGADADDEQQALELAYQRLANSVLYGEFEANGRSQILYLEPKVLSIGTSPYRLTRDWFQRAVRAVVQFAAHFRIAGTGAASSLPMKVLVNCWLPHEMARRWLASHGYRWAPHFEPAQRRRPTRAIIDFDLRLGWIPLADALEIIGTDAWESVKRAIQGEALRARCRADGIMRDLKPHWLDFLAYDRPEHLWFDREKVWRARSRDSSMEPVPDRASQIVLSLAQCRELWPDRAWPDSGHSTDEFAGGTDPLGRSVHPFRIGETHSVFEWCMIYTDRHPGAVNPNYNGPTLRDREFRLDLLGATGGGLRDAYGQPMGPSNDAEDQIRNEIYRELVRDIEHDRIIPAKTAYCSDAPDVFDPTRCLLDIDPILALARRRGDFGPAIAELLTARPPESDAASSPEARQSGQSKRRRGPVATVNSIKAVAEHLFASGKVPGSTVTWKQFQTEICKEIGVKAGQRGYSLDTVQAAVRPILPPLRNRGNNESTEN